MLSHGPWYGAVEPVAGPGTVPAASRRTLGGRGEEGGELLTRRAGGKRAARWQHACSNCEKNKRLVYTSSPLPFAWVRARSLDATVTKLRVSKSK